MGIQKWSEFPLQVSGKCLIFLTFIVVNPTDYATRTLSAAEFIHNCVVGDLGRHRILLRIFRDVLCARRRRDVGVHSSLEALESIPFCLRCRRRSEEHTSELQSQSN